MDYPELLRSNLALVERLVRFVCRSAMVRDSDVEDLASAVKLALVENDYAVLRAWKGHSSLATYLTVIIQRVVADERIRDRGRFRPSAEAKRLGDAGVALEMLLRRDERSLSEAIPMVQAIDETLSAADIESMAARLPQRAPRPRLVAIESIDVAGTDETMADVETREASARASRVARNAIASLPLRDRMLLRLRFVMMMSIADAARILQIPQRPLYRRQEQILKMLSDALRTAGIDARAAGDLIGSAASALDFGLGETEIPPSTPVTQAELQ